LASEWLNHEKHGKIFQTVSECRKSLRGLWEGLPLASLGVGYASRNSGELFPPEDVQPTAKRKGMTAVDATTIPPISRQDAYRSWDRDATKHYETKTTETEYFTSSTQLPNAWTRAGGMSYRCDTLSRYEAIAI
jgi:hypothetical protein